MDQPVEKRGFAWQPLTPSGMAAFARASLGRLLLVQLIVALFAGAMIAWFLHHAWFPVITQAIHQLPDEGEIGAGRLQSAIAAPVCLAENRFLALAVDRNHEGQARSPAHLAVEFGETDVRMFSLLGYARAGYPAGWRIAFNRSELEPWWGAWSPALLAIAIAFSVVALMLCWAILASLYFLPAWLAAFFANRNSNFAEAWRLAGAALLPAALFLAIGIWLYGLALIDLIGFFVTVAIHFVLGWVGLVLAVSRLPRHPEAVATKANPFAAPAEK
jgi:hypothetical protein